jgi:hypothetical protein
MPNVIDLDYEVPAVQAISTSIGSDVPSNRGELVPNGE